MAWLLDPGLIAQTNPPAPRAYRTTVQPHWFAQDTKFWYRNDLKDSAREFVLVDAAKGTRQPAFDHARVATELSKLAGTNVTATTLPIDGLKSNDDATQIELVGRGKSWLLELPGHTLKPGSTNQVVADTAPVPTPARGNRRGNATPEAASTPSPDAKWEAFVKEHNLWLCAMAVFASVRFFHSRGESSLPRLTRDK